MQPPTLAAARWVGFVLAMLAAVFQALPMIWASMPPTLQARAMRAVGRWLDAAGRFFHGAADLAYQWADGLDRARESSFTSPACGQGQHEVCAGPSQSPCNCACHRGAAPPAATSPGSA